MVADPVSLHSDFFEVLGVERRFGLDLSALERRYYELARSAHPDRSRGASPLDAAAALDRMSRINEAYTALKNPDARREHLLALEGAAPGLKTQAMPASLAEGWFELQDALVEEPANAGPRVDAFESEMRDELIALEAKINSWESEYDSSPRPELLALIAKAILERNFLKSLERDIARVRERILRAASA